MIVGIAGYARSGKDTLADQFTSRGYEHRKFSQPLKDLLYRLDLVVEAGIDETAKVVDLVDYYGWDGAKDHRDYGPEVRRLLQELGTGARDIIGPDVWVDAAMRGVSPGHDIVFSDVRFPNEAQAIWDRGGVLVRIFRPGVKPVNAHVSETALDNVEPDLVIRNDSTPEAMMEQWQDWMDLPPLCR